MAILTTINPSGSELENTLDDDFAMDLLFTQRTLSEDGRTLSWTSPEVSLAMHAEAGFDPVTGGTVTSLETDDTLVTGLAVDLQALFAAFVDGNLLAANNLFWGAADSLTGAAGLETLRGYGGDDTIRGGGGADRLFGDAGRDRLFGDAGEDYLSGGSGGDSLSGGSGNDTLVGGAGNDRLAGGAGLDRLLGGSGADTFVFAAVAEASAGAPFEVLGDFRSSDGDVIDVSGIDANTLLAGNQPFAFIASEPFSDGVPGTLRWVSQPLPGGAGVLSVQLNTDADALPELVFVVAGASSLAAADFLL